MNEETLFQIFNTLALLSWIVLWIFPYKNWTSQWLIGVVITILAVFYSYLVLGALEPGNMEDFNSLGGVMSLFTDKTAVLAGWIHYLAFDLMTGI